MKDLHIDAATHTPHRECRSGAALLHDLKNQARTFCYNENTVAEKAIHEWAAILDRFFDFAIGCCKRDEAEGAGSPGDLMRLERRLQAFRALVANCAAGRSTLTRIDIENIWRFLQAEESDRGAFYRSIADEVLEDTEERIALENPIVRAMCKVLAVFLPPATTFEGNLVLDSVQTENLEVLWTWKHGTLRTGIMLPSGILDKRTQKLLKSITGSIIVIENNAK